MIQSEDLIVKDVEVASVFFVCSVLGPHRVLILTSWSQSSKEDTECTSILRRTDAVSVSPTHKYGLLTD